MIASIVALLFLIIAVIRTLRCSLSPVVKETVSYIKHHIHRLTYPPWKKEKANEDYRLEEVTRQLYEARMNQGSTREKRLAEQTEHS